MPDTSPSDTVSVPAALPRFQTAAETAGNRVNKKAGSERGAGRQDLALRRTQTD